MAPCCICSSIFQNCRTCKCVRQNVRCTSKCRKGNKCRNKRSGVTPIHQNGRETGKSNRKIYKHRQYVESESENDIPTDIVDAGSGEEEGRDKYDEIVYGNDHIENGQTDHNQGSRTRRYGPKEQLESSIGDTLKCCVCGSRDWKCANCSCCKRGVLCTNCDAKNCENQVEKKMGQRKRNKYLKHKRAKVHNERYADSKRVYEGEVTEKENGGNETENRNLSNAMEREISCFIEKVRNFTPDDVIDVRGDGNCFFRCLSIQIYGDEEHHESMRKKIIETEKSDERFYSELADGNFQDHIEKKTRSDGHTDTYATEAEVLAASDAYDIDIFVQIPRNNSYVIERYSRKEKCDHSRPYMAIRNENDHYKKLTFRERPCECKSEKDKVTNVQEDHSTCNEAMAVWKHFKRDELEKWVNETYGEIVFWKSKLLIEPVICKEVKELVREMTGLLNEYIYDSPIAGCALKMLLILPNLILQRPNKNSKHEENMRSLRRRMALWQKGDIGRLWEEAYMIHNRFEMPQFGNGSGSQAARRFGNLMQIGKVNPALRILSADENKGVLPLTPETRQALIEKHPVAKIPPQYTKLDQEKDGSDPGLYTCLFDTITDMTVWKKAVKTQGGAGPSGLNANFWRCILSQKKFGKDAADLANAVACLSRKLATEECNNTEALTACRLIPLDKNPGVRPIGIGEALTRIIGKCIMEVVKKDVRKSAGNLQVCAGHQAGGEAAIHAVSELFENKDIDGVLLVDARNAFNSINREAMLHNIKVKCPPLSQYVYNTYKHASDLYICGGSKRTNDTVKSVEGTRQGDPIAMAMYSIGMSVLQSELSQKDTGTKAVAYADDLVGTGQLDQLFSWWKHVGELGPDFGYFPNAVKSVLIVKPEKLDLAKQMFRGTNVQVKKTGHRYLGAALGSTEFQQQFVKEKVDEWIKEICYLSDIAKTEPHAAYSSFVFGLKHKWTYLSRTVPDIEELLMPLEKCIRGEFIPVLTRGHLCSDIERDLLALPPRLGGLGIVNPCKNSSQEYKNSKKLTASLASFISAQDELGEVDDGKVNLLKKEISKERQKVQEEELKRVLTQLSSKMKKKVEMAQEVGASNWLTSLPIKAKGFSLNKQEFTDSIALRYGWPIANLLDMCPCGTFFNEDHAMICPKGGFVCIRHDEVRDITAAMLRQICSDVTTEPSLLPVTGENFQHRTANTNNEARLDISANGFWTRGEKAFFDIRIFDPLAASHQHQSLNAAHRKNELEKIRKYRERITRIDQGSFTPLVFTTSGGMGPQAKTFYTRVADIMAEKRGEPKAYFTAWLRTRLSFSLLRSSLLCLRGTRTSRMKSVDMHALDFEDVVLQSRIM